MSKSMSGWHRLRAGFFKLISKLLVFCLHNFAVKNFQQAEACMRANKDDYYEDLCVHKGGQNIRNRLFIEWVLCC